MTPLVRRCAVPLSVAVAAGLMVVAPAQAAPTWLAPVDVQGASSNYPDGVLVEVDGVGAATAVWMDYSTDYTLVTSSHEVGGTWSAPAPLSALGVGEEFDLAVGANGDAVAAWVMPGSGGDQVEATHRAPGGSWSPPVIISTDDAMPTRSLHVGMDAAGNALAVWDAEDTVGSPYIASATTSRNAGWSGASPISLVDVGATDSDLAVAPDGAATVVWSQSTDDAGVRVIEAASRSSAAGTFGDGVAISAADALAGGASVAVNAAGAAAVAWSLQVVADHAVLWAAVRPAGGTWRSSQQVSADSDLTTEQDDASSARLVVDGAGAPTLIWSQRVDTLLVPGPGTDTVRTLRTASATSGGAWSAPGSLGALSGRGYPSLVVDGSGTTTAVWRPEGQAGVLSQRPAGGSWSGPMELETRLDVSTSYVAVAADPAGDLVAVWSAETWDVDSQGLLRARAYDADGPLVNALSIPGSGTVGTPLAFSVSAVDVWSAVTSTSWSFGDGTTASGASVGHTYANAGAYAVSVTVTDALGNARSRTGTTVVAAAPVVTPPAATPKPKLTGVKLTKKTIHVKGSDESPKATKLQLTLNTDAKVKVVLKRTKKVDGKAVKATVTKALTKGSRRSS